MSFFYYGDVTQINWDLLGPNTTTVLSSYVCIIYIIYLVGGFNPSQKY